MACWILTNPRSGSSYLMSLLNKTGLFIPKIDEYFNFSPAIPNSFIKSVFKHNYYWENCKENKSTKDEVIFTLKRKKVKFPVNLKVHKSQFNDLFDNGDLKLIEELVGAKVNYIWLERNSIFERVISNYFSSCTNKWAYSRNDDINSLFSKPIPFDESKVLKIYKHFLYCERNDWDKYLGKSKYLKINYNNLIGDTKMTLEIILDFLNLDYSSIDLNKIIDNCHLVKATRPETKEYIERLKELVIQ